MNNHGSYTKILYIISVRYAVHMYRYDFTLALVSRLKSLQNGHRVSSEARHISCSLQVEQHTLFVVPALRPPQYAIMPSGL